MAKATKIHRTKGKGISFQTTGILHLNQDGTFFVENDVDGAVTPHYFLEGMGLDGELVTIKIVREDDKEEIDYTEILDELQQETYYEE